MRIWSRIFVALTLILSHWTVAQVAYTYCTLLWGGRYAGYSAPPETAFFLAIPGIAAAGICLGLAIFFKRKTK